MTDPTGTVPHSAIRKRAAQHLSHSKQTAAHVYTVMEADFEAVDGVRLDWWDRWKAEEGFSLTYLPFIAAATLEALEEFPLANSVFEPDHLVVPTEINLGIAVDLDYEGLVVPVIHGAATLGFRGMARRIREVGVTARQRKLGFADMTGGTFTITNLGPSGTLVTLPIINFPQVAILSTDGVRRRPTVITANGVESIVIHPIGHLALAWDHRAFDGAYAAAFLGRIRTELEQRDWESDLKQ